MLTKMSSKNQSWASFFFKTFFKFHKFFYLNYEKVLSQNSQNL